LAKCAAICAPIVPAPSTATDVIRVTDIPNEPRSTVDVVEQPDRNILAFHRQDELVVATDIFAG
jgi:hypothetical protein